MSVFGPVARRDPGSGFELHGRWFADPYAWMECVDDAETRATRGEVVGKECDHGPDELSTHHACLK